MIESYIQSRKKTATRPARPAAADLGLVHVFCVFRGSNSAPCEVLLTEHGSLGFGTFSLFVRQRTGFVHLYIVEGLMCPSRGLASVVLLTKEGLEPGSP